MGPLRGVNIEFEHQAVKKNFQLLIYSQLKHCYVVENRVRSNEMGVKKHLLPFERCQPQPLNRFL